MATLKKPTTKRPAKTTKKVVKKAEKKPEKHGKKTGRPVGSDEYKPEYDDMIVEHMRNGYSAVSFAAKIGVAKSTVYEWAKTHESFSNAFTRARTLCQAWWEDQAVGHLEDVSIPDVESRRFNDRLWLKNVACRFRDDWAEKKTVTIETSTEEDKSLLEKLIGDK